MSPVTSQDLSSLALFGMAGPACAARGWTVYPQEGFGGTRRPGTWRGRAIQLRSGELGDLASVPLPREVVLEWARENPRHNVACLLGRGSGGVLALDFDVNTPARAAALRELAFQILGPTPFIRIGNAPRFALIYASDVWDGPDRVASTGRRFDVNAGAEPGEALEVLGEGKSITLLGRHHKTGRLFQWIDASPLNVGPDVALRVDGRMLAFFLDEVHRRFPFSLETAATVVGWSWDETTRGRVPRLRLAGGTAPWRNDPDTGLVVDGREAFLTHLCFRAVINNPELIEAAVKGSAQALGGLHAMVDDVFRASVLLDAKWPVHRVSAEIRDKLRRLVRKVSAGELFPHVPNEQERGSRERTRLQPWDVPPELRFLKPRDRRHPTGVRGALVEPPDPIRAKERTIEEDRDAVALRISSSIDAEIQAFLDRVYDGNARGQQTEEGASVHVLKAPTGAGKTSRLLAALLSDPRTASPPARSDDRPWGPFIVLLPTFANIQELVDRLVQEHAHGVGAGHASLTTRLDSEEFLPIELPRPDGAAVSIFVYRGKIKAGCRLHEKVALLMQAGKSSSALCRTEQTLDGGERHEVFCPHYDGCPAILQRERAAQAHVVFMPHAFLRLAVPEQLRNPRGLIIDERVHHLLLHTARLSLDTLGIPRPPPRLTKKERESGVTPEDFIADREALAGCVLGAIDADQCPAEALLVAYGDDAMPMVRRAARVCSSGLQRDDRIHPGISFPDLAEICAEPKGFEIREEWRFWRLVEERIEGLKAGLARGDRDVRLQRLSVRESNGFERHWLRLSWRGTPNWRDIPTLLLDASATPEVVRKVFPTTDLRVADLVAEPGPLLNIRTVACVDRTFSPSSLLPKPDAEPRARAKAERDLLTIRRILQAVSLVHGYGRVLVGGPKAVLEALRQGWNPPVNLDWAHFGAMRGLDAFKAHAAAVSIGRMEPPLWEVDAAAAALTFDDAEPELPFDRAGTGCDPNEPFMPLHYPMASRRIPLRDGSTLAVGVPEHPGVWGRLVQAQIREEEQRQFFGRLRPVYRQGPPPIWYCLSSVVPEGVIVDDACSSRDLFDERLVRLAERVSLGGGLLATRDMNDKSTIMIFAEILEKLLKSSDGVQAALRVIPDDESSRAFYGLSCLPQDPRRLRILRQRACDRM